MDESEEIVTLLLFFLKNQILLRYLGNKIKISSGFWLN